MQRKPNGQIILGAGDDDEGEGHGDILMSYLIGLFVLYNADNLEEFGVRPGSSQPEDEDRELTPEEKKMKIQEAIGLMPEEMQNLFRGVLQETDPIEASMKYEQQVQREIRQYDNYMGKTEDDYDMRFVSQDMNDAMWEQTKANIYDYRDEIRNDPSRQFNVDDWL